MPTISPGKEVDSRAFLASIATEEPAGLDRLVTAMEADYQFRFAYLVLTSVLECATVTIVGAHDEPTRRLADNLLTHWCQSASQRHRAIAHGRSAFEKSYRIDRAMRLALLDRLTYLPIGQSRLRVANDGMIAGVELREPAPAPTSVRDWLGRLAPERPDTAPTVFLDADRIWWFALDPTPTQPQGVSRYLGAPLAVWHERRKLDRQESAWFGRFAIGHAVARAPDATTVDPAPTPLALDLPPAHARDPMFALQEQLQQIESGGTLILSSRMYPNGEYLYSYQPSDGQRDASPLEHRRSALDIAVLRSLGIPERSVIHDHAGSHALARAHQRILYRTCEGILSQMVGSFQEQVIEPTVALNWPSAGRPSLKMIYQPFDDQRLELISDVIRGLCANASEKMLATTGGLDVTKLFEVARLPTRQG